MTQDIKHTPHERQQPDENLGVGDVRMAYDAGQAHAEITPAIGDAAPRRARRRARAAAAAVDRADRAAARRRARPSAAATDRMERHRRGWLKAYGDMEPPPLPGPPDLARRLWIRSQLMLGDPSSDWVTAQLNQLIAQGYGEVAGAGWIGAVVPLGDGTYRYTIRGTGRKALRARRILTVVWIMCELEKAGIVRGVSVCTIMRMIRDVHDGDPYCRECGHHHPSRSAANHRGRGGTLETGDVGYFVALELAGAIHRHQWRTPEQIAENCEPWEIGDSGYPCNEYRLCGRGRTGRTADSGHIAPALIVRYAMLRDVADDAVDGTRIHVLAPYGWITAQRAQRAEQHVQAPP